MLIRKITIRILSLVFILTGLLVGGRWIIFWQIKKALVEKLGELGDSGITVRYKNLDVDSRIGHIDLSGVDARWQGKDSLGHSGALIPHLLVKGIHLLPLLLGHKLVVDSVIIANPQITYTKRGIPFGGESSGAGFLKAVGIGILRIDSGTLTLINKQSVPQMVSELGITLAQLDIQGLDRDSTQWSLGTADMSALAITLPNEFYEFSLQNFFYSNADQRIRIDSIRLKPLLGHLEFAQQAGHQIDRIQFSIPHIDMTGVVASESFPPRLAIQQVDLAFMVSVYRDTRFPSANHGPAMLPIEIMHQIPFPLRIDSILLHDSSVSYEEVPHEGDATGKVAFHAIEGSISNITTDSIGESTMQVTARFMNAGDLEALLTFPMAPGKSNSVQATLTNFSMPAINSMLLPIANLEVQSGMLQALHLQFHYNEFESNGELDLQYTDLHLKSIRQNKKRSTNKVVTVLINTMVQNNMDRSDMKAKRSGKIAWKRDIQAGLPSYWWKSILSGLRSVYRLENVVRI